MLLTKSVFNSSFNACSGASSNKLWSNLVPRSLVDEADKRSGYIHIYRHKLYFNSNLQSSSIKVIFSSTRLNLVTCRCEKVWLWRNRITERFPFNKNSGLKFTCRKFHVSNHVSGCTDSTQATARLVIVLVIRIQNSGTGNNNFIKRPYSRYSPSLNALKDWWRKKAMSRGFSGGKQMIKSANARNHGRVCL